MENPATAVLHKEDVKQACQVGPESRRKILESLLQLFGDKDVLPISANEELDKVLRRLAKNLRPMVRKANSVLLSTEAKAKAEAEAAAIVEAEAEAEAEAEIEAQTAESSE